MTLRREFLKISGGSALVSFAPWLPGVLSNTARAVEAAADEKVLLVIQLDGGNDGINTLVPFGDDGYAKARKKLHQKTSELHKLNDHVGLHRSMKAAFELFDDNRLAIVQGVGYPNPDRSHFRSMKVWQTASLDSEDHSGNGWLGKALDQRLAKSQPQIDVPSAAKAIFVGEQETPPALWGRRSSSISLSKEEDLQLELSMMRKVEANLKIKSSLTNSEQFVYQQAVSAREAAKAFADQNSDDANVANYPNTQLASQLKFVSKLLRSGSPARVYYTIQSGYDTHSGQESTHANLLSEFSGGLQAFLNDLKVDGLEDRVIVMAFSEFGRRVAENDSAGTDHGSAGPVFIAGSPIRGGLVGATPDLTDLIDGDLKTSIDFRNIYATILTRWLGISAELVLGTGFEQLDLFS